MAFLKGIHTSQKGTPPPLPHSLALCNDNDVYAVVSVRPWPSHDSCVLVHTHTHMHPSPERGELPTVTTHRCVSDAVVVVSHTALWKRAAGTHAKVKGEGRALWHTCAPHPPDNTAAQHACKHLRGNQLQSKNASHHTPAPHTV